ncbi:rRNA maturation RNase YbeY [Sporolactobacillus sp. KGMB 08714]|uniref:rRNA maturation RNase YbeY n=1 Tax=Sporolactobacillus sp. KGMB 08714 TaxID=3064704 RepID=UPI002FBF1B12
MTMTIDIHDETGEVGAELQQWVIRLIDHAAEILNLEGEIECSLTFVRNPMIQEINRTYRGIDRATDVISFALEEMEEGEVPILPEEGEPRVLGDIVVSIDKAREQAEAYDHSFERELGFLIIHGLLHLLGYDHTTKAEEEKMFGLQEDILSSFGLKRF